MRQPRPWFRSSKNAWYVEHRGKQCRLGDHPNGSPPPKKTKAGWNAPQPILDAFYKLMATDLVTLPKPADILTVQVCDLFLAHAGRGRTPLGPPSPAHSSPPAGLICQRSYCEVHA
jgi:integrase/recombinase XerD